MKQEELRKIGYQKHYYEIDSDSNTKQCFNCKYGYVEKNRELVHCNRWNITVNEDDICNYFELHRLWAFNCMDEDRERREAKLENAKKSAHEGCYIATAIYGGYDQPQVLILRKYRDEVLMRTLAGRFFVQIYYFVSPWFAERLKNDSWINRVIRTLLDKLTEKLAKDKG